MRFVAIDLETVRDETMPPRKAKTPQRIKLLGQDGLASLGEIEPQEDDFPPPPYWRIVAYAATFVSFDEGGVLVESDYGHEADMIDSVIGITKRWPLVATYNGRGFDVPVLLARAMRHRRPWPWYYANRKRIEWAAATETFAVDAPYDKGLVERLKAVPGARWDAAAKVWRFPVSQRGRVTGAVGMADAILGETEPPRLPESGHLDLMDELQDFGATRRAGLDAWCATIGVPPKPMTGTGVETLLGEHPERVAAYCAGDALRTAALGVVHLQMRGFVTARVAAETTGEILRLLADEDQKALGGEHAPGPNGGVAAEVGV